MSLCYRCEHRARFLEDGRRPRYECGEVTDSKTSCYMHRPVSPVVVDKANDGDPRPQFGPAIISARSRFVRVATVHYELTKAHDGHVVYCVPDMEP